MLRRVARGTAKSAALGGAFAAGTAASMRHSLMQGTRKGHMATWHSLDAGKHGLIDPHGYLGKKVLASQGIHQAHIVSPFVNKRHFAVGAATVVGSVAAYKGTKYALRKRRQSQRTRNVKRRR